MLIRVKRVVLRRRWLGQTGAAPRLSDFADQGDAVKAAIELNGPDAQTAVAYCALEATTTVETARNSGEWKFDGTAFKYTVDGLHPTPFSHDIVAVAIDLARITRIGLGHDERKLQTRNRANSAPASPS
ncbi:hypothetical protein NKI77_23190 [Mesorhizobium opportunistum]|uniref:SGNH hydrolase-type esterase domain-containing protein n=1 Tax=Mesorhizobium opportunistum TaxID=593909 RepID=A0ABV1YJV7_9HYPH|nr:hypothetical protein [Mesorhizobium sp.]TJV13459.1 MAG: hypothetical protein E5Y07_31420 [Mesorhizobium sp.]TJV44810.1 MAG: hypothetical protein E5Y02_06530 [Mesorhizobium sp.]